MTYKYGASLVSEFRVIPLEAPERVELLPLEGPEGTSSGMASDREYIDLKLETAEARAEKRFAEINARLDRVLDGLAVSQSAITATKTDVATSRSEASAEARSTRVTIVITTIATGIALASLLLAVMTYGDALFGRGMNVRDVVTAAVKELAERQPAATTPSPAKAPATKSGQ